MRLTLLSSEADLVPLVAVVSCSLIWPSTPRTWASRARACASLAASFSLSDGTPVTVPRCCWLPPSPAFHQLMLQRTLGLGIGTELIKTDHLQ